MIIHIWLVLVIVMSGESPDVAARSEARTIDECWSDARDWVKEPLPHIKNAVGRGAECSIEVQPQSDYP